MSGQKDSDMMEMPSMPSSGLAGMPTYGTPSQPSGTPARLSFKEKLKQGLDKKMSLAMEGLSSEDNWDSEQQEESKAEPVLGSRSLPLRSGDSHGLEQSYKPDTPQLSDEESDSDYHSDDQEKKHEGSLSLLPMGKNEHVFLTHLVSSVQDIYEKHLKKNGPLIKDFVKNFESASPQVLSKVDKVISQAKLIGDHQDLLSGLTASQQDNSTEAVFKWAVTCSPKCLFLQKLFESLRPHDINIAILARPGQTLDILTSMLEAQKVSYVRPDACREAYFDGGDLRVTLLPTGFADGQYVVGYVDGVIAFDSSFFTGEVYTTLLRSHTYDPNLIAPLISLVTNQSAEHIELCLSKNMDSKERKAYLCFFLGQLGKNRAGELIKPRPEDAAPAIAEFLIKCKESESPNRPDWPISQDLGIHDLDMPSGSLLQSRSSTQPLSVIYSKSSHQATNKRTREVADDESTKRMRMTPVQDQPSSEDISRVMDSAPGGTGLNETQSQPDSHKYWTCDQVIADRAEREAKHREETAGLFATVRLHGPLQWLAELTKRKISELQAKLQAKNHSEARILQLQAEARDKDQIDKNIRQALHDAEQNLAGHVRLVEKFQPAYQQLTLERNQAAKQLSECEERAATLSGRLEARTSELNKAKLTINKTQEELNAARDQLLHSTIPEIHEFEEMRRKLQTAEKERDEADKRYQSLDTTYEYTKEQYQKVSHSAGKLNSELQQLREEYEELERKAGDNKVKILQIQAQNNEHELVRRIEELKQRIASLDAQLEKKTEELNKRGGRSLRGVSGGAQSPMVVNYGGY